MIAAPENVQPSRTRKPRRRRRILLAAAAVAVTAVGGTLFTTAIGAETAAGCSVEYQVVNQWSGGFLANVSVTNLGDPVSMWTLNWEMADGQSVRHSWNATVTMTDDQATARNSRYNGSIATNGTASFGFIGAWRTTNPVPSTFMFNGTQCNGTVNDPTTSPAATTATSSPTAEPTTTPTATPTTTSVPSTTTSPSPSTTTSSKTTTTSSSSGLTSSEQQVFDLVNAERTANGCQVLVIDPYLQKAAHNYAVEMVETHNFSHTSVSGLDPTARAKAAGYNGGVGENIAMGYLNDPSGVVAGWMNSSGHRANILNCSYTKTGVGYDPGLITQGYASGSWVQDFGF